MTHPLLPLDLAGCKVTHLEWPAQGFRMHLGGRTSEGRSVDGAVLGLVSVANQHELRQFLGFRFRIVLKDGYVDNKCDDYPLKLPATLTTLTIGREGPVDFGDEAFTDRYGRPPALNPKQHVCRFALQEKRFRGRGPFPVIFERLSLSDANGEVLIGSEPPPPPPLPDEEYERLGMQFFEAVVMDQLDQAWKMLSAGCRKRLGKVEFRRRLGEYRGSAKRLGQPIDQLRPSMAVNVESDEEIVWQLVQSRPEGFPRESARALLDLCSDFFREGLGVYVVLEGTRPCLDLG